MLETSARLLALLGLLQSQPAWAGADLAQRLEVTPRTIRNDVERLRDLGYPISGARGPAGGYRLGPGAKLPPLLLDDSEAVAVAIGLRAAHGVTSIEESSASALTKLEQVLPHRLRRRVEAITDTVSAGPVNTDSNVEDPQIAPETLSRIADAIRDEERLRLTYGGDRLDVEPYRVITWQRRWYLVAREVPTARWRALRVDWAEISAMPQPRFSPQPMSVDDYTTFVVREIASGGWSVHARITVLAPAEEVRSRINDAVGVVEPLDDQTCVLVTGADSIEILAVYVGMLGLDFRVDSPPELVEHVRLLGRRYAAAAG
ncbi:helix-turn-helix transcriptional regulator [Mumia zhuanghuii]|uniref:WYL domain-containing protein n=1 Tax=Mumia zhuanghuii TaxID=2585211 RepID=A0A5C4MJ66_9ACTN|nr:WYL domain-containing protein [Mumia zhuanghuii]TNC44224.1 WYL domain-containing protein [Mumia zhuanghuii]TNC52166.1 WYL domain-containing protein [Mumia zhuanghuii]